eukprot:2767695-Pleurochrysis_carterae.AAC.4
MLSTCVRSRAGERGAELEGASDPTAAAGRDGALSRRLGLDERGRGRLHRLGRLAVRERHDARAAKSGAAKGGGGGDQVPRTRRGKPCQRYRRD